MKLFFSLFRLEIPCYILCATILIAALSTFLLVKCRKISLTLLPWIIACLYLMLYITVFSRSSGMDYSYHLQPFWSYGHIKDGYVETFYENIYNVLFFMPYGILLGLQLRILSLAKITSIGSLTSIVIELLQLISRRVRGHCWGSGDRYLNHLYTNKKWGGRTSWYWRSSSEMGQGRDPWPGYRP